MQMIFSRINIATIYKENEAKSIEYLWNQPCDVNCLFKKIGEETVMLSPCGLFRIDKQHLYQGFVTIKVVCQKSILEILKTIVSSQPFLSF